MYRVETNFHGEGTGRLSKQRTRSWPPLRLRGYDYSNDADQLTNANILRGFVRVPDEGAGRARN